YALGAEDEDEFFGRIAKGLRSFARKAKRAVKKYAPAVGRIAGTVSRVARYIPHPYAQAVAKGAGVVSKAARLAQRLRAEGASEEEALDAFAELAARDRRALPIVAAIGARTIVKSKGKRMSKAQRKAAIKNVKAGLKTLVNKQGKKAARAAPKIIRSVKRTAARKATPTTLRPKIVKKAAQKVARSRTMTKALAKPKAKAVAAVKKAGAAGSGGSMPRSYTIPGPARITITAA
ncbi:MAG: hypothetical protein AAF698_11740, partial [Pseudomonadota bacterium]